jgi:hypothetical protein
MTKAAPSSITILVKENGKVAELELPVEAFKIELNALLEKLQYLIKPANTTPTVQIEELQFDIAIANDGKLVLLSANVTDHDVAHTVKLRVKRVGTHWKLADPPVSASQAKKMEFARNAPVAVQATQHNLPAQATNPDPVKKAPAVTQKN